MRERRSGVYHKIIVVLAVLFVLLMCGTTYALVQDYSAEAQVEEIPELEEVSEESLTESDSGLSEEIPENLTAEEPAEEEPAEQTEPEEPAARPDHIEEPAAAEYLANMENSEEPGVEQYGSVSGRIWFDENEDGRQDTYEEGIAGFTVGLYREDNLTEPVEQVQTGTGGWYEFANIEPGSYRVGIESAIIGDEEYLLPLIGITEENHFQILDYDAEVLLAYTDIIVITPGEEVTGINAGMREPMGIVPAGRVGHDRKVCMRVMMPDGTTPAAGVKVNLSYTAFQANNTNGGDTLYTGEIFVSALTDSNGYIRHTYYEKDTDTSGNVKNWTVHYAVGFPDLKVSCTTNASASNCNVNNGGRTNMNMYFKNLNVVLQNGVEYRQILSAVSPSTITRNFMLYSTLGTETNPIIVRLGNSYKISENYLNTNGNGVLKAATSQIKASGQNYTGTAAPATLSASGQTYVYQGWRQNTTTGNYVNKNLQASFTNVTRDHTVNYYYTRQIGVTFELQGGTPTQQGKNYLESDTFGSLPVVTRSGYTFLGWYTASGGGTKVETNTNVGSTFSGATGKLYARWVRNIDVTFNPQGGTPTPAKKAYKETDTFGTLPVVTYSGYVFKGWYNAASGGTKIETNTNVGTIFSGATGTIFAQWHTNPVVTEVYKNINGGASIKGNTAKTVVYNQVYSKTDTAITGYQYMGWRLGSETAALRTDAITAANVTVNQTVYLYYASPATVSQPTASEITTRSFKLNGVFNLNGGTFDSGTFLYGKTTPPGSAAAYTGGNVSPVQTMVTNLEPNTKYYIANRVRNRSMVDVTSTVNETSTVTTKPDFVSWSAEPNASDYSKAMIKGDYYVGAQLTAATVVYGTAPNLDSGQERVLNAPSDFTSFTNSGFTCELKDLLPGRRYYVRTTVTNSTGTTTSAIKELVAGDTTVDIDIPSTVSFEALHTNQGVIESNAYDIVNHSVLPVKATFKSLEPVANKMDGITLVANAAAGEQMHINLEFPQIPAGNAFTTDINNIAPGTPLNTYLGTLKGTRVGSGSDKGTFAIGGLYTGGFPANAKKPELLFTFTFELDYQ